MSDRVLFFALIVLPIMIVVALIWWAWYCSSVQAEVYRRQGAAMSTWEVFIGAKPIIRQQVGEVAP